MKFRIVPKRDFGSGKGFYDRGRWIKSGFVVTDGVCNVMPGATWFETVAEAMIGIRVYIAANGDAAKFWHHYQPESN